MFYCYLCNQEFVLTSYHCEDCLEISRIIKVVGKKDCLSILKNICMRNAHKQTNKVEYIKKEMNEKNTSFDTVLRELNNNELFKKKKII